MVSSRYVGEQHLHSSPRRSTGSSAIVMATSALGHGSPKRDLGNVCVTFDTIDTLQILNTCHEIKYTNKRRSELDTINKISISKFIVEMSYNSAITTKIRTPRLRLLNALHAGSKPITTFLGLPSFRTAQVLAQTGVDVPNQDNDSWCSELTRQQGIIVDCEHGNIDDQAMHSATAAISAMEVSPLVRLRMSQPDLIKRALDAGVQ